MSKKLFLLVLILSFLFKVAKAHKYTSKQIVDYWENDEQKTDPKYRDLAKYLDYGLPDSVKEQYHEIANLIDEDADPKIKLYFEISKLITGSDIAGDNKKPIYNEMLNLLPLAAKVKNDYALAWYFRFLGDVCFWKGELEKAVYYLKLSVDLHEKVGIKSYSFAVFSNVYYSLAKALYQTRDYKKCIYYGQLSLKYFNLQKNESKEPNILMNDILGAANKKIGQYKTSIFYYQQITNAIEMNHLKGIPFYDFWYEFTYGNIGQAYLADEKISQALPLLERGLNASIKYNDQGNTCEFLQNIANIYYLKGEDEQAIKYALKAETYLNKLIYKGKIAAEIYKVLYQANQRLGSLEKAITYLELYNQYQKVDQSLIENSKLKKIETELYYNNIQKQEGERLLKINQLTWIRNSLIGFVILLSFFGFFIYRNYKSKQQKKIQILALETELKEQEVENALSQIEIFKKNIFEKEDLIASLEAKAEASWRNVEELPESLHHFTLITDDGWNKFRIDFTKAYPRFLPFIRSKHQELTQSDERLAMLIFLKLDNEKIAHTLGISKDSVSKSKRRLRANLNFNSIEQLEDYIITLI
ncbi:tetratricopeptide repeat protein [Pedobacter cryophilus]|uniref:Tetratricopeptide repeat protein n=1 Tax=Pedobacter cryophilus TaxID=2571271 RepID=A0A4U1C3G3_9SPHI|nr:tetratricopeptide repeat protein [Pedobacter cryophilus]TKC00340.1 tetratricopeptide repeat protein [Pedobacter cryophilus]